MRKFLSILGVCMSLVFATQEDMPRKTALPKYESLMLENGLQVVVIPMNNHSNVIQTSVFYKVGSRNEMMGKSGIAHMLEHMNFKSTKNLRAGEFDEIVKKFGGVDNASTGFDYTHYFIKSSTPNLAKSLELFAELMGNLSLKDEDFQPERDVVAEERRWRTDNSPIGYLYFRFFNTAYIYHPYHWTPIGFMDDILNWNIKDIENFHSTYYQPQNAIVLIAGDVEAREAFALAREYFGKIQNTTNFIPKVHTKEPEQDGAREAVIYKDSPIEYLAFGYKIPSFNHEDQVALSALSLLLSNGKSSILYKDLVDSKRMVNQIYGYNMDLIDEGIFMFIAAANEGVKASDIKREIESIILRLQNGEITQEDLDKLKINTKADFYASLEDSSSVADLFGSYFARGDIKPLLEYEERFDALKIEDLVRVAKKYLVSKNSTTLILKGGKK